MTVGLHTNALAMLPQVRMQPEFAPMSAGLFGGRANAGQSLIPYFDVGVALSLQSPFLGTPGSLGANGPARVLPAGMSSIFGVRSPISPEGFMAMASLLDGQARAAMTRAGVMQSEQPDVFDYSGQRTQEQMQRRAEREAEQVANGGDSKSASTGKSGSAGGKKKPTATKAQLIATMTDKDAMSKEDAEAYYSAFLSKLPGHARMDEAKRVLEKDAGKDRFIHMASAILSKHGPEDSDEKNKLLNEAIPKGTKDIADVSLAEWYKNLQGLL